MRRTSTGGAFAVAFVVGALAATGAAGQEPASDPAPADAVDEAEAGALDELARMLDMRRAALDARRSELARERALLSAVDRAAGAEELARWRERNTTAQRLVDEADALEALAAILTPEALAAATPADGSAAGVLTPDPRLARTRLPVNLRDAPGGDTVAVLKANAAVAHLAAGADGWSIVATAVGIGFAPTSQLRREP